MAWCCKKRRRIRWSRPASPGLVLQVVSCCHDDHWPLSPSWDQANAYLFGTRRVRQSKLVSQAAVAASIAGLLGGLGLIGLAAIDRSFFAGIPSALSSLQRSWCRLACMPSSRRVCCGSRKGHRAAVASIGGAGFQLVLLAGLGPSALARGAAGKSLERPGHLHLPNRLVQPGHPARRLALP